MNKGASTERTEDINNKYLNVDIILDSEDSNFLNSSAKNDNIILVKNSNQ